MAAVVEEQIGGFASLAVARDELFGAGQDQLWRVGVPVVGHGVPHDWDESEFAGGAQRGWAARAEGWAKILDWIAEDLLQFAAGAGQLFAGLEFAGDGEVGVTPGVVADQMACRVDSAHQFRLIGGVFADQEERGFDAVRCQRIEQLWGPAWVGAVVEGEGDFIWLVRGGQCAAVDLRSGPARTIGARADG